jgi:hypothetical protein
MKIGKILLAALALSLFSAIFAALTCGGAFNWVYKLEPTIIWKPMQGPPGLAFHLVGYLLNALFALVYALIKKGLPGKGKFTKGLSFGLCLWLVGTLPGMFATYAFMNIATGVVIYWTLLALVELPLKGIIVSSLYGE